MQVLFEAAAEEAITSKHLVIHYISLLASKRKNKTSPIQDETNKQSPNTHSFMNNIFDRNNSEF